MAVASVENPTQHLRWISAASLSLMRELRKGFVVGCCSGSQDLVGFGEKRSVAIHCSSKTTFLGETRVWLSILVADKSLLQTTLQHFSGERMWFRLHFFVAAM